MQAAPPPIPLKYLRNEKCTVGCHILDSALNGGIPCGSITELVGECGSGKTQLALQLLLCAQLPFSRGGLEASSVYIHSEGYFASRRLRQLSQAFISQSNEFQSELYHQCIGAQPEVDWHQKNCFNTSEYVCNQCTCAEPQSDHTGVQHKFELNPINGLIAANRSSEDGPIVSPFVGQPDLVHLRANGYKEIQSDVPMDHSMDPQPNGLQPELDEFLIKQLVPAYTNLNNDRAHLLTNGGQPKSDRFPTNLSSGAHTEGSDQPWTNGFAGSQSGAQLPINHGFGSQLELSYVAVESESGQLPLNCRLGQSRNSIITATNSMDYEDKSSKQQSLGKRKDGQSHNAGANEKRTRCVSNLEGDQDTEFWGAINSNEWQALDSITKSHVLKPITDATISENNNDSSMINLDPCDNIFVQGVHTIEELLQFLEHIEILLSKPLGMPVRLLIIDSVAALFRSDFDNNINDM
ncbi:hypothetical protein KI387_029347, partial [Taxus chinensis]